VNGIVPPWSEGAANKPPTTYRKTSHPHRRDRLPLPPALHQDAEGVKIVVLFFEKGTKTRRLRPAPKDQTTFDLSMKNPNGGETIVHRRPQEIMDEIAALDAESARVLETIRGLL
jgi:hypothetical protein